ALKFVLRHMARPNAFGIGGKKLIEIGLSRVSSKWMLMREVSEREKMHEANQNCESHGNSRPIFFSRITFLSGSDRRIARRIFYSGNKHLFRDYSSPFDRGCNRLRAWSAP